MKNVLRTLVVFSFLLALPLSLMAHCEIPCGIYTDKMRVDMIDEHVTTIEKSMKKIAELSKEGDKNYNQLVRWITNKEEHASKIQHIVTQYFMTQRIKLVDAGNSKGLAKYQKELALLHEMLIYSMKSKQTTDLKNTQKLREVLKAFADSYFTKKDKVHMKGHH